MAKRKGKFTYRPLNDSSVSRKASSPYNHGAICRIKLVDFMTYKSVEVKAGPYLNLIIGPNGTGKSAIVCGIIIGLGGDSHITGRAGSFGEYIRFNCNQAEVYIELFNANGANFLIERRIVFKNNRRTDTRSEWLLNGNQAQAGEVKRFIAGLNISIDNLCQFLPQERVVEFVKMNSRELLENTEKAVGDPQTHTDHQLLIKLTNEIKTIDTESSGLREKLETQINVNLRLEKQVQIVQEKQQYEEQIGWLNKKRPWMEYEVARRDYLDHKKLIEKKEKELQKIQEKDRPIRDFLSQKQKEMIKLNQALANFKVPVQDGELRKIAEHSNLLLDKRNQIQNSYTAKLKIREQSLRQIEQLKSELQMLEAQLDQLQQMESPDEKVGEIDNQIQEARVEVKQLDGRKQTANETRNRNDSYFNELNEQLRRLTGIQRLRFERLQQYNSSLFEAVEFYRTHRNRFQGSIYLPYLVINVKERTFLSQMENVIPFRDLYSFVVEQPEDLKLFTDMLHERSIRLNCVLAPRRSLDSILAQRLHDSAFLTRYGLQYWIDELFTCPDSVKAYFCSQYRLYNIAVGNESAQVKRLLSDDGAGLSTFYAGTTRYDLRHSRFDKTLISSRIQIRQARNLVVLDDSQIDSLKTQLDRVKTELQQAEKEVEEVNIAIVGLERNIQMWMTEKRKLLDSVNERKRVAQRIKIKEGEIESRQRDNVCLDKVRQDAIDELLKLSKKQVDAVQNYTQIIQSMYEANTERVRKLLLVRCQNRIITLTKERLAEADLMNKNLMEEIRTLHQQSDSKRTDAQRKFKIANQATGTESTKNLPPRIKKIFDELPNTVDELDQKLRNLVLRINALETDNDSSVIETYDKNVNMIKRTEEDLQQKMATCDIKKREREAIKARWLEPLNRLVAKIDENFARFMSRLNCSGNVKLSHGQNPDNFEEYGITIMVRYRKNEELKELSATHQSGGERSVATMVYMIALQELTKVPFRCVDEINQGMDDRFERSVFDLIVETASKSSSQYFLLTPKLLHDLNFTDKMQIHIVFNGPTIGLMWQNDALYEDQPERGELIDNNKEENIEDDVEANDKLSENNHVINED